MLAALGREFEVHDERQVAMATAVSGTGPTYIFLFIEALTDAAVHLGFPRHVARELVLDTMQGSAEFALQSGKHVAQLRDMVTSPGGHIGRGALRARAGRFPDRDQRLGLGGVPPHPAARGDTREPAGGAAGGATTRKGTRRLATLSRAGLHFARGGSHTPMHDAQNPSHRHAARGRGGLAGRVRGVAGTGRSFGARGRGDPSLHHRADDDRALRSAHEAAPFAGHRPPRLVVSDAPRVVEEGRAHGPRPPAQQPVHVPGDGEARGVLRDDPARAQGARNLDAAQQDASGQPAFPGNRGAVSALLRPRGGGARGRDALVHEAVRRRRVGWAFPASRTPRRCIAPTTSPSSGSCTCRRQWTATTSSRAASASARNRSCCISIRKSRCTTVIRSTTAS